MRCILRIGYFLLLWVSFLPFSGAQEAVAFLHPGSVIRPSAHFPEIRSSYVNFEQIGGFMIVKARIGSVTGDFILDTGAPGLVLNEPDCELTASEAVHGVLGVTQWEETQVREFEWSGIWFPEIRAYRMDLGHLSELCGKEIRGLIGYEVLKDFEITFYPESRMIRLQPASAGRFDTGVICLPIEMQAHLPVLCFRSNQETLRLGLDTGAEVNFISSRKARRCAWKNGPRIEVVGVDGRSSSLQQSRIRNLSLQHMDLERQLFTVLPPSALQDLDGIAGFPMLGQMQWSLNYRTAIMKIGPELQE